jgi:HrpA-like RNA helicase
MSIVNIAGRILNEHEHARLLNTDSVPQVNADRRAGRLIRCAPGSAVALTTHASFRAR